MQLPGRVEGGLVHDVGNVGPREAGGEGGQPLAVPLLLGQERLVEHDAAHVPLEDLLALGHGGQVDGDAAVEAAGPQQGLVQHVRPVRGGFLKIISVGILTYGGMKTGFYADFSPRNQFSCWDRPEWRRE